MHINISGLENIKLIFLFHTTVDKSITVFKNV